MGVDNANGDDVGGHYVRGNITSVEDVGGYETSGDDEDVEDTCRDVLGGDDTAVYKVGDDDAVGYQLEGGDANSDN